MTKSLRLFSITLLLILSSLSANSQTVYTWNGSVNTNFSTAANWTPVRQIGLVTDILIIENSGSLYLTNVYQVTLGQLIIRNNTNLTLSPSSGNSKLITIKGGTGEDLVIESGSSLKISGNDPALNIYLGTGATASIYGNLTFESTIEHYINAADEMAIKFHNGSALTQLCPGNIFNTVGVNNAVVFESGSQMEINHSNALSPFGFSAPNSKVLFEESSVLSIVKISSLKLAGRNIANLKVEQGSNINISESFTSDINISNIIVKNGGTLTITNTNSNYVPALNISGNIDVNGTLKFTESASNKLSINFNGTRTQVISGNGSIIIPSNLNRFELSNSISLQRDLTVNCPIVIKRYEIIKNGFEFIFNPEFGNPFNGSKSSTLSAEKTGKNNGLTSRPNESAVPSEFSISQNYPNPFNPSTKIDFTLPSDSKVTINIFDITGKKVASPVNTNMNAGFHTVSINGSNLSSGVYFYTINAGSFTKTLKMILAK